MPRVEPSVSVVCQQAGHRYGRRVLFSGLDLVVRPGEVVIVAGANGSGKTTLLKLVAGLLRPATGVVELRRDDQPLDAGAWRAAVGYSTPDLWPYRVMTVRENLDFFARVRGMPRTDSTPWAVEMLGLGERLDQRVGELSAGYVQRVRLALALGHDPAVLLLDEPGATLDEAGREAVSAVVRRQAERGLVLLATNDPREMVHGRKIVRLGG